MENNLVNVTATIANSQDGKKLRTENDEYSAFILAKIDEHLHDDKVDVETLISDFNYMVNQLKAAIKALEIDFSI